MYCVMQLCGKVRWLAFVKFASKQMERSARKCEKDEKAEKVKLKKVRF